MTSALDRSGYQLGSGMLSPDGKKFLLTIPKNASSMLSVWAGQNGWLIDNAKNISSLEEIIIVLRDPIVRWVSGIAQYVNTYILHPYGPNGPIFPGELITDHDRPMTAEEFIKLYNPLTERLFFDVIDRFDDHVLAQSDYLNGINESVSKKFFLLDKKTTSQLSFYLNWKMPTDIDNNSGYGNEQIKSLQIFFQDRLKERPELVPRIYKHYAADVELLKQI